MRVSQLTRLMDKDDEIIVNDDNKSISCNRIYRGYVRGIKKDDPINKYHVTNIFACDNRMVVFAVEPKMKGGE